MPIPNDLSKLSNVVKNDVVKKTEYNKSVAKVDDINTNDFVLKTKYSTDKTELENKIPDISGLVTKAQLNVVENKIPTVSDLLLKNDLITIENKIPNTSNIASKSDLTAVENKIPNISNLARKTALTTVENKIPDISNLVKKTDYNTKITNIENKLNNHNHDKYIDTSKFDTLATNVFNTRLAQANLITKTDFNTKLSSLNRKISKNKADHLIAKNELNKLKTFDSSYFIGKSHFEDGTQNCLIFQPMYRYFKTYCSHYILSWTSKRLSNESIKPPSAPNNFLTPSLNYLDTTITVTFSGSCLKQDKVTDTHEKIVNTYIVCEINKKDKTVISDPTLENCLFGAVILTKHVNFDKYGYSGFGIGFDKKGSFSFPNGGYGQNIITFGVYMSSSIDIDNKKKDILILGRGPTQGLESTLTSEKMYSINFTEKNKKSTL